MRVLVVAVLVISFVCSSSLGQCNICSAVANGFCPSGSGSQMNSQCQSCGTVSVTGCQTCGGGSCFSTLAACNAACTPVPNGVMVGVALYSSSTSCSGTLGTSLSYQLFEVNRCDNLHQTGFSLMVSGGPSGCYNFTLFSNNECSASSPTITNFGPSASGSCTTFQSISVSLFTPTTTATPVPMSGTFTQTACSSPTNPSVTCASVFSTSYTSTQTGYNIAWSGPASSGTVYDKGLFVIRTTGGGSYGSCYGWINGLQLKIDCFTSSTTSTPRLEATYSCSGCVASTTAGTTQSTASPTTAAPGAPACFHETTTFVYKANNKVFSLRDLPIACRVPHRVRRDGLAIFTACDPNPLRLTRDHLVFSLGSGLVAAGQLKVGDVLFADLEEKTHCPIKRITSETDQLYFGLNCLESVVLASGIKTSTFGSYHTLPAVWMSWAGWALGINHASQVGDLMASAANKIKLI